MNRNVLLKALPVLIGGVVWLTGSVALPAASYTAKRGDFPRCQEECFTKHRQQMERLFEDAKHTLNVIQFQEQVDGEVAEYQACLSNCRELMPVK